MKCLHLESTHTALIIFDGLRGQNSPEFIGLLESHNISCVRVPPNCTDKLHPLDISFNKTIESALRKHFQSYYATEVMTQLFDDTSIDEVQVDMCISVIKPKCASWIMASWQEIEERPELALNGFKKEGIFDIINNHSE